MKSSYPLHRKSKIEGQLIDISDPMERLRTFQILYVLNRVIEADLSHCQGCVADCVGCLTEKKRQLALESAKH